MVAASAVVVVVVVADVPQSVVHYSVTAEGCQLVELHCWPTKGPFATGCSVDLPRQF